MNYQPFLEMNLLVSDALLADLNHFKSLIIFMSITAFYLLFVLHITFYKLYMTLRAPKRKYPAHIKQAHNQ